jgi:hypothetical protein
VKTAARISRPMAIVLVLVTAMAAVVIACVGPGHVLMSAGAAGDGPCGFLGHTALGSAIEELGTGAASLFLMVAAAVAALVGRTLSFASRDGLSMLVPAHVEDDPRHGRLLI